MLRKSIPTVGAIIALLLVLGIFPRGWMDALGISDVAKGIIVLVIALGVAWAVEKFLKKRM